MADQSGPRLEAKVVLSPEAKKARAKDFIGTIISRVPNLIRLSAEAGISTVFKPKLREEVQEAFAAIEGMRANAYLFLGGVDEGERGVLGMPQMEAAYLQLKNDLLARGHIKKESKK
jgi:hypothetical protein